jgi:1-deoxy-D-xylulose-5-phosphate synthase
VLVYGLGQLLPMAREFATKLEAAGYSVSLVNPRCLKPFDNTTLERLSRQAKLVVTFEEHVLKGGFGSIVLESLNDLGISTPVVRVGYPDEFVDHGKVDKLRERYGVSVAAALAKALPLLAQK